MNSSAKNVLVIVVCVIALFIPSYIAIAHYVTAQNAPVEAGSVSQLEITDLDGQKFTVPADNAEGSATIRRFTELNDRAAKLTSLPEQLAGSHCFTFKYFCYDRVLTYQYYFTKNPIEAYFLDHNGDAYHVTSEDAVSFLKTEYARCLFPASVAPTMMISGETVNPSSAEWRYQVYQNEYVALDNIECSDTSETVYRMKGAFAVNFDNEPDYISVTINSHGEQIYHDIYANVANAALEGTTVDVIVEASWYSDKDASRSGEATYKFKAKVLMPAVFYLGCYTDENGYPNVEQGDFFILTGKNVDNPSAVTFTSEPDIGYHPTWYADGDYVYALVPVPFDFNGSSLAFTCSYGEVAQKMEIDIRQAKYVYRTVTPTLELLNQTRTDVTVKAFNDIVDQMASQSANKALWDGTFVDYSIHDPGVVYFREAFGAYCTIELTQETYRNMATNFQSSERHQVIADNAGTVIFKGYFDYAGQVVVIDHGLGLKSWYMNLSDAAVEVGDSVSKEQLIGYAGRTGYALRDGFSYMVTVGNVPVCPYDLWEAALPINH